MTVSIVIWSMRPKVEAACEFVRSSGGTAGIGKLGDAMAILTGKAGTVVSQGSDDNVQICLFAESAFHS